MTDPTTKEDLESEHFLNTSPAVRNRLTSCLRSEAASIRPFSRPSAAIEAVKLGLNLVQPRIPSMKPITDPECTFQASMVAAVKCYKEFNGLVDPKKKLTFDIDRITLTRLDTELTTPGKLIDLSHDFPEFGSTKWRFTFLGNRGVFGKGIYSLVIASTESQDSRQFVIQELSTGGELIGGFMGETQGTFCTDRKMLASDFETSTAIFTIIRRSGNLSGNMQLSKILAEGVQCISFELPHFHNQTIALSDGMVVIRGQVIMS